MEKNGQYEISIYDISNTGEGIGRIEGMVTFVPGLIPGDGAIVEIVEIKKNLARARIISLKKPSDSRVEPVCAYADRCGGCTLQHMDYRAQLELKKKQLRDKLERIYGGDAPDIEEIAGMDEPWHFRNKTAYAVYAGKAITQKDGSVRNSERPRVGFYDGKGRNIVEAESCPISSLSAERAADALRSYIKSTGITVYDERSKKGRLRQMVVRCGFESREVMVTLVINGKKLPQPELLTELMFDAIDSLNDDVVRRLEEAAEREGAGSIFITDETGAPILDEYGNARLDADVIDSLEYQESWYELKSLIVNYNSNKSLAEISTKHDVIYGQPVIRDSCAGMSFEISPFSFYQVNPVQMERLYSTVLEFADLKGDETVFDLYCGVGTIGLYCARSARQVWGIESVKSAVIDANRNAVINGIVNIQFINGRAEEKIFDLLGRAEAGDASEAEAAASGGGCRPDVVIVDPPRAGCRPELLEAVMKAAPEKIIYVSCDPGTLARDLKILTASDTIADEPGAGDGASHEGSAASYKIERIRAVDNFCHSTHVETVVLMSRR